MKAVTKKSNEKQPVLSTYDPLQCPFRDFKDSELSNMELWGTGPSRNKRTDSVPSTQTRIPKGALPPTWKDDQEQPLPSSLKYLVRNWVRAEELATEKLRCELVICDEEDSNQMNLIDMQNNYSFIIQRSSFCRRVLSSCFILEHIEGIEVEHQWEGFNCIFGPDGWRVKYHIYSPGMKPGGGLQHRPTLSKNGCYLIRLYFLGAWRCVWVDDLIPVNYYGNPLLPFAKFFPPAPKNPNPKQKIMQIPEPQVYLWPALIIKALLKLAAPVSGKEDKTNDEALTDFDVMHCLTGSMSIFIHIDNDENQLWEYITKRVPMFAWDEEDEVATNATKAKGPKKPVPVKEAVVEKRKCSVSLTFIDTKEYQPYFLPGITPCYETSMLIKMARDLPLKKPLPLPEIPRWKEIRWVYWAMDHGLYKDYECPRTKYLKIVSLLKLSHAPHLLDIESCESLTREFCDAQRMEKTPRQKQQFFKTKEIEKKEDSAAILNQLLKGDLRDWVLYDNAKVLVKNLHVLYFPSMFEITTAASSPPIRITKAPQNRALDIKAPKNAPLYLQTDGPGEIKLHVSLNTMNQNILANCGTVIEEDLEPSYVFIEEFEWFKDSDLVQPELCLRTYGYNAKRAVFPAGRYFFRVWVHSRLDWHINVMSEAKLLLGRRDLMFATAVRDLPWVVDYLTNIGSAFQDWIKVNRSAIEIHNVERAFYETYAPDQEWKKSEVGYPINERHWMFRRAIQAVLQKKLKETEFKAILPALRNFFRDPYFGYKTDPTRRPYTPQLVIPPTSAQKSEIEVVSRSYLLGRQKSIGKSKTIDRAQERIRFKNSTIIQSWWRGIWTRRCMKHTKNNMMNLDVARYLLQSAFGTQDTLSNLMSVYFDKFPTVKSAYKIFPGLRGFIYYQNHTGNSSATAKCKWVPYFQGQFRCHEQTNVHFDLQSPQPKNLYMVYNNDTGKSVPHIYNSHFTYDIVPNNLGYTVIGYGMYDEPLGENHEINWSLSILTSVDKSFHICDNNIFDHCNELPLVTVYKLRFYEIFVPNKNNIIGGIHISICKDESVCLRVEVSLSDLLLIAIVKRVNHHGEKVEVNRCYGKGKIFWPLIRLHPEMRQSSIIPKFDVSSKQSKTKPPPKSPDRSTKSITNTQFKHDFYIEIVAPDGWPLTVGQWSRVKHVRETIETRIIAANKARMTKPGTPKDKDKEKDKDPPMIVIEPENTDAFATIELSYPVANGIQARRDEDRINEFVNAAKEWDVKEPGRNLKCSVVRDQFRSEVVLYESSNSDRIDVASKLEEEDDYDDSFISTQTLFMEKPEILLDKFVPLTFVHFCTLPETEPHLVTSDDRLKEKQQRHEAIEEGVNVMVSWHDYNIEILARQHKRIAIIEKLCIDSQLKGSLETVMRERDQKIQEMQEALAIANAAAKKKNPLESAKSDNAKKSKTGVGKK